jgi:hypothetical protein
MKTIKSRPVRLELSSSIVSLFLILSLVPPLAACKEAPKAASQQQTATGAPPAGQTASSPATTIEGLPDLPKVLPIAPLQDVTAGKPTYLPAETIEGWKKADDRAAMKDHAWRLFAALMRPMYRDDSYSPLDHNAVVRAYDTWHSIDEAVPEKGAEIVDFSQATTTANSSTSLSNKTLSAKVMLRQVNVPGQISHQGEMTSKPLDSSKPSDNTGILGAALVSDVKYSDEIVKFVEDQLMEIEDKDGKKVVKDYKLAALQQAGTTALDFADTKGIMVKPAYTIVKGNGPTVIGRWDENVNTVNPVSADTIQPPINANTRVAGERTWTQEAIVVPPGQEPPANAVYGRDGAKLPTVNVNDFHHFKLTDEQAAELRGGILKELMGPNIQNIEAGDYAILTSMHISSREVDDWTWQTFWWQPKPDGSAAEEESVPADIRQLFSQDMWKPLSYFKVGVGYDYLTPDGKGIICSNPYLEGPFGMRDGLEAVYGTPKDENGNDRLESVEVFIRDKDGKPLNPYTLAGNGLKTNCVSCHRAAAYPADSLGKLPAGTQGVYPDYGAKLADNDPLFSGRVVTHFLWGVANKVTEYSPPTAAPVAPN